MLRKMLSLIGLQSLKTQHIIDQPKEMTALEAMEDLYHTLPPNAAENWLSESRGDFSDELRDPLELEKRK